MKLRSGIKIKLICILIVSMISTLALGYIMAYAGINRTDAIYILIFVLEVFALQKVCNELVNKRRYVVCVYMFSCCFAIIYFVGKIIDSQQGLSLLTVGKIILASLGVASILGIAVSYLEKAINVIVKESNWGKIHFEERDRIIFVFYFASIFVMWFPVFLAYYPGIFTFDAGRQVYQGVVGVYTTHHPLVHTLCLRFFYGLGDNIGYNSGIALYVLFQMIISALSISYMILFLYRVRCLRSFRIGILLFCGLMPFFSIFVCTVTKDILFSCYFLVVCTCLGYWSVDESLIEKRQIKYVYIIAACGMCLFRNNGVYAIIIMVIISVFLDKKYNKIAIYTLIGVCLYLVTNSMLIYKMDASKGSINEMLSVPIQQVAYVYNDEKIDLSEELKMQIEKILPSVDEYQKHLSDPVKATALIMENKKEFIDLYTKLFIKYPFEYLEAFLLLTEGLWYVDDVSHADVYGYQTLPYCGYLHTGIKSGMGVEVDSKLPWLRTIYDKLMTENEYQKFPPINSLFKPAIYVWLLIYAVFDSFINRNGKCVQILTLVLAYLLTVFLGPCAIIRYVVPIILVVPIIIILLRTEETMT